MSELLSMYEAWLAARGAVAEPPPPAPIRASAAIVLWRANPAAPSGIEVYWVKRSEALKFMGGWHAFPGGGLSRSDAAIPIAGKPAGLDEAPPVHEVPASYAHLNENLGPDDLPGLVTCALRELFEETGVLPGLDPEAAGGHDAIESVRARLVEGALKFDAALAELRAALAAHDLLFAGRWLTPPFSPMRFDNRFFLLHWPHDAPLQPHVVEGELSHGEWICPRAAFASWEAGAVLAAPPILHVLRVLGEHGVSVAAADPAGRAAMARLRSPVEADLGPLRRVEFRPGVILFPLATPTLPPATHTNTVLLGAREMVLIDPGTPFEAEQERLRYALAAMQEQLGRTIKAIWLTHHHPDHVGAVNAMRAFLNVPVLAHPLTAARLASAGVVVEGTLNDGDVVDLQGGTAGAETLSPRRVRVIHTPGHARGHLCFFDEMGGSLIAGDMVAGIGTIVIDPPEGDMQAYLDSLERLVALEPKTLFPAHGPVIKNGVQQLKELIAHRLWREERIRAAWEDGLRDTDALVARAYDDTPQEAWPIAARQLLAHLDRLRAMGRIASR